MSTTQIKTAPDAPESNAGDDFHILWAVRKSLSILDHKTDNKLLAVSVEGANPNESQEIDPYGELLLGVDITEYFGAENYDSASKVIFSQLKYSTRQSNKKWSCSELTKKKGKYAGSIIHRLASIYKTYKDSFGEDSLSKLQIKLVSNRSLSEDLISLFKDIFHLQSTKQFSQFAKLKIEIDEKYHKVLDEIHKSEQSAGLKSVECVEFFKYLDFSECGTDTRFGQKQKSIEIIASLGFEVPNKQLIDLKSLISDKMMPENRSKNLITEKDILFSLGFGRIEDLFPVPSKIEECTNYIERIQTREIAQTILSKKNKYYIHGGAGCGKSTLISNLLNIFPEGSIFVTFDCYGAGAYLNPSDKRHKHKWGILQIANELALQIGTPLLLIQDATPEVYIRELKIRLNEAIQILRSQFKEALLVLIIDAADNSITASHIAEEESFVKDLIKESLPDECKLILTTRTSRVETIPFNNEFEAIEIEPFNEEETKLYVNKKHPDASDDFINDFHSLTNGVPRVQAYALNKKFTNLEDILKPLRPDGKHLFDLFNEQINIAIKRSGYEEEIIQFLKYVINFPRPIPISIFAYISGVSNDLLKDFVIDLAPGVYLENDTIIFKDEDFETFLRDNYEIDKNDYKEIATVVLEYANKDQYCCIHLANFLKQAGLTKELHKIVLENSHLESIEDVILRKEIVTERIRIAMECANQQIDIPTFVRLQLLAADTVKSDNNLQNLLIDNIDLVTEYSLESIRLKKNFLTYEDNWYGSYYAKLAAATSRDQQLRKKAELYLKETESWFSWCMRLIRKENDYDDRNNQYNIDYRDIANATETYLNLYGPDEAAKYLKRWRPKSVVYKAIVFLLKSLLDQNKGGILKKILNKIERIDIKLLLLGSLYEYGIIPDIDCTHIIKVLSRLKGKITIEIEISLILFCEYLAIRKYDSSIITNILSLITQSIPKYIPPFSYNKFGDKELEKFDLCIRTRVLTNILNGETTTEDQFIPKRILDHLESEDKDKRKHAEEDKRKFERFYSFIIPYYNLRVQILLSRLTFDKVKDEFTVLTNGLKGSGHWELKYYNHDMINLFNFTASRFLDTFFLLDDDSKKVVLKQIQETFIRKNDTPKTEILITTSDRISKQRNSITDSLILKSIDEAVQIINNNLLPYNEVKNYNIRITKLTNRIDLRFGVKYFQNAIETVNLVDDEDYNKILAVKILSKIGIPNNCPKLAYEFGRYAEYVYRTLFESEYFPMKETLEALVRIDPSSSLALLCRWDHRDLIKLEYNANHLINILCEQEHLNAQINAALWTLSPFFYTDSPYVSHLSNNIKGFDRLGLIEEKHEYIKNIIHDTTILAPLFWQHYYLREVRDVISQTCSDYREIEYLDNYLIELDKLKDNKENGEDTYSRKRSKDFSKYIEDKNYLDSKKIEAIVDSIIEKDHHWTWDCLDFVNYVADNVCETYEQDEFLKTVCRIDPQKLGNYHFGDLIIELIDKWKYNPLVNDWMKEGFKNIIQYRFSLFIEDSHSFSFQIKSWAEKFDIEDDYLSSIIKTEIALHVNRLSSQQLFDLLQITALGLNSHDNYTIINDSISIWSKSIKKDFGDGVFNDKLIPTRSINEAVASMLQYTLGHPNREHRWKAAHALRRLVQYGDIEILSILLKEQNRESIIPFQDRKNTFFWISSKLNLWMTINQIAHEKPEVLIPFIESFILEINISKLPHALINFFIKNTCFAICEGTNIEGKENIIKEIEKSLLKVEGLSLQQDKEKFHFKFDQMDSIPYWYDRLNRLFKTGRGHILSLADEFIYNVWNFKGDVHKENHVRPNDYNSTQNRHGLIPQYEDLQRYYEFHAMFCVASILISENNRDDESYEAFEEWVSGYTTVYNGMWLSDLRDPIPLDARIHEAIAKKDWISYIEIKDYTDYIGLVNDDLYLTLNSNITNYHSRDYESIEVGSAIVSRKNAKALVRILNSKKNKWRYSIPFDDESEDCYNEDGFILKGLFEDITINDGNMDERDSFANDVSKRIILPAKYIMDLGKLRHSDDYRLTYSEEDTIITKHRKWDNTSKRDFDHNLTTTGQQIEIQKEFLFYLLEKEDSCLLLELSVVRKKEKDHTYKKNRNIELTSLFLLYPDGTIEETRRNPIVREDNY